MRATTEYDILPEKKIVIFLLFYLFISDVDKLSTITIKYFVIVTAIFIHVMRENVTMKLTII